MESANVLQILIKEDHGRDRAKLPVVEIFVGQGEMLIAMKDANIKFARFCGDAIEYWQIVSSVAAPVFREHQDVHRLGKRVESAEI